MSLDDSASAPQIAEPAAEDSAAVELSPGDSTTTAGSPVSGLGSPVENPAAVPVEDESKGSGVEAATGAGKAERDDFGIVDESPKVEELSKVDEPARVEEGLAKVDDSLKVEESEKVDEPAKVEEPSKVDESAKVVEELPKVADPIVEIKDSSSDLQVDAPTEVVASTDIKDSSVVQEAMMIPAEDSAAKIQDSALKTEDSAQKVEDSVTKVEGKTESALVVSPVETEIKEVRESPAEVIAETSKSQGSAKVENLVPETISKPTSESVPEAKDNMEKVHIEVPSVPMESSPAIAKLTVVSEPSEAPTKSPVSQDSTTSAEVSPALSSPSRDEKEEIKIQEKDRPSSAVSVEVTKAADVPTKSLSAIAEAEVAEEETKVAASEELVLPPPSEVTRKFSEKIDAENRISRDREIKSLIAWTNTFLKGRGFEAKTLTQDFRDGVLLINLLEAAFNEKVASSYNMRPRLEFHKLDNMTHVFNFLAAQAISTQSIDANDIVQGKEKQTLVLLWNLLRKLTLRGLNALRIVLDVASAVDGGAAGSKTKQKESSVKSMLVSWTNEAVKASGATAEVTDLWDSLKDGIALSAIIEELAPGNFDVKELKKENAAENLKRAFEIAEKELGIPSLLQVEDFMDGKEPDEKGVENYLCMLVSAQKSQMKREEHVHKLQKQMDVIAEEKEKEIMSLMSKIEEEKKQFEALQTDVEKLKEMYQSTATSEAKLQEQIEKNNSEKLELLKKFEEMQAMFTKSQALIQESAKKEQDLAAQAAILLERQKKLEADLKESKEDHIKKTSELYKSHKEYEDVLNEFRKQMKDQALADRHSRDSEEALTSFLEQSLLEQKGFSDFMSSLRPRKGWFMKQRPKGKKKFGKARKRWFELKGDHLYWYKNRGDSSYQGHLNLKWLERIDTGMESQASMDLYSIEARRQSQFTGGSATVFIDLKPSSAKGNPIKQSMRLMPVGSLAAEYQTDVFAWAEDINDRIALIRYLSEMYEKSKVKSGRIQGCRELVNFIADGLATYLKIENKVPTDFHPALQAFKESLMTRKNLNMNFSRTMLPDDVIPLIADIVAYNNTMRLLYMPSNLFTAKHMEKLTLALDRNYSLEELDISYNKIGDDGCKALADGLSRHAKLRRLTLSHCSISDEGVKALVEAFKISQTTFRSPHIMPVIELEGNLIKDDGCKRLADLVKENGSIQSIRLTGNLIGDEGAIAFSEAVLSRCSLEELLLASNEITTKGAAALATSISRLDRAFTIDLSQQKLVGKSGFSAFFDSSSPIKMDFFKLTLNATKETVPIISAPAEEIKLIEPSPLKPSELEEVEPPKSGDSGTPLDGRKSSGGPKKWKLSFGKEEKDEDDGDSSEDEG